MRRCASALMMAIAGALGCSSKEPPAMLPDERASLDAVLAQAGVDPSSLVFFDGLYALSWRGAESHARAHGRRDQLDRIRKRQDDMRNAVAVEDGRVVGLRLARTRLTSLSPVARLSHLVVLDVHDGQIADPAGIEALRQLDHLDLAGNRLESLAKVHGLPALRSLYAADNPIAQIDGLDDLPKLEVLNLAGARITRIQGLAKLDVLRVLSLERNPIERIEGLEGNPGLEELNLSYCWISRIENLGAQQRLVQLNLWHNRIARLEGVEVLSSLVYLGIGENPYAWTDPGNEAILKTWGAGRMVNAW